MAECSQTSGFRILHQDPCLQVTKPRPREVKHLDQEHTAARSSFLRLTPLLQVRKRDHWFKAGSATHQLVASGTLLNFSELGLPHLREGADNITYLQLLERSIT